MFNLAIKISDDLVPSMYCDFMKLTSMSTFNSSVFHLINFNSLNFKPDLNYHFLSK